MTAILFDMGGVLTTSPFENFTAYETEAGLPDGLIRRLNSTDPDTNAWARLERGELDDTGFVAAFEAEAAAAGHDVDGQTVLDCLHIEPRPAVLTAVRAVQESGVPTALLTNNHLPLDPDRHGPAFRVVLDGFGAVIESSVVGARKPEPRFYELACERLGVEPGECWFLDDLGINLKPARAMGMTTVKIASGDDVIAALVDATGLDLAAVGRAE